MRAFTLYTKGLVGDEHRPKCLGRLGNAAQKNVTGKSRNREHTYQILCTHPDSKVDVHHERTVETLLGPIESEDSRDHVGLTTWQVRYT